MPETLDIAVVGATGLVGEALVELLEERDFPVANLYLLASGESAGKSIGFRGRNIRVASSMSSTSPRCAWLSSPWAPKLLPTVPPAPARQAAV